MHSRFTPSSSQATAPDQTSGISNRIVSLRATRILGAAVSLLMMLALKRHYSLATADQLDWILAPTANLVAWLTPAHPVYESGVGYVDFARGIIVAPACAGVNFMIMAFGLAALCGLKMVPRATGLTLWLILALCSAFGYTLMVNTVRIGLSMLLYSADIYGHWMTAERIHRLAGIGLYLGALGLFFKGLQFVLRGYCVSFQGQHADMIRGLPGWLPLLWYLLGAIGVPLANLLFRQRSAGFGEHCITVLITVICIWGASKLAAQLLGKRARTNKAGSLPSRHCAPGNQV